VRPVLGGVSLCLLLFLAWRYLAAAWRGLAAHRRGEPAARPGTLDSTRAGYFLGFGLALSSPWNLAFWLAVLGHHEGPAATLGSSLLLALAVVTAATTWTLVLSTAAKLGARFATPLWDVGTRAATGIVLLAFAALLVRKLVG
jgi:threonine/homoserine/homoserine lactone efflux protein